jgi:redox-sensitive bicupin YhaK (pirin superfamily)
MNASIQTHRVLSTRQTLCSAPIAPKYLEIGNGFTALSFKHASFDEIMDPLIMVDHFRMSKPTFGEHGHAGISAVSVLFEDSEGAFNNRDSLGNNIDLKPGDLYWLKAGKGAMHDEKPLPGARTHGLQMFVNLPASQKHEAPEAVHVKAGAMPIIKSATHRVRVVLRPYRYPYWMQSCRQVASTPTCCPQAKVPGFIRSRVTRTFG